MKNHPHPAEQTTAKAQPIQPDLDLPDFLPKELRDSLSSLPRLPKLSELTGPAKVKEVDHHHYNLNPASSMEQLKRNYLKLLDAGLKTPGNSSSTGSQTDLPALLGKHPDHTIGALASTAAAVGCTALAVTAGAPEVIGLGILGAIGCGGAATANIGKIIEAEGNTRLEAAVNESLRRISRPGAPSW